MLLLLNNLPSIPFLSNRLKKDCEIAGIKGYEKGYANLTILSFILSFAVLYFLVSPALALLISITISYYIYTIPRYKALVKIAKFRSDSLLTSLYISVSVLFTRNLENSLLSASQLLNNSSSKVLKEIVSGLKNGKYKDINDALNNVVIYDPAFTEAMRSLLMSMNERTRGSFEESIDYVLKQLINSNISKMKDYMESTINPIRILFSVFILLPLMLLIIIPIVSVFLSEEIPIYYLVIIFNIFIPLVVLMYSQRILLKRPPTLFMLFLPQVKEKKPYLKAAVVFAIFLLFSLFPFEDYIKQGLLLRSIMLTSAFAFSLYTYYYLKSKPFKKLINKRDSVVRDFKRLLHNLSLKLSSGLSFEAAFDSVKNIFNLHSDFYEALIGLIKQSADRSSKGASFIVKKILAYIESIEKVDSDTKDIFSDTISTLNILAIFVVPLVGAVAVSLGSMIIHFLNVLSNQITTMSLPSTFSLPFISVENVIPVYLLQLVIGVYVVQMILIVSKLEHVIRYGFTIQDISSNILLGYIVYLAIMLFSIPLLEMLPKLIG